MLTGLAGSVGHCLGMCGPLVILAGARYPGQGAASTPYHLLYHGGRILIYIILGILSGALGGVLGRLAAAAKIPGIVSLCAGVIIIFLGLNYLGWLPFWKRSVEGNNWWTRLLKRAMKAPGIHTIFLLGMLNGILPCGLVYEALVIAGASGSAWVGGLGMLLFGLATMPTLVVFGVGAQMISLKARRWIFRVGGVFAIIVGVLLILRGVNGLGAGMHMLM